MILFDPCRLLLFCPGLILVGLLALLILISLFKQLALQAKLPQGVLFGNVLSRTGLVVQQLHRDALAKLVSGGPASTGVDQGSSRCSCCGL